MSDVDSTQPTRDGGATWEEFADAAPELAAHIRDRFAANRHHVLGTVRPTGAPRLSGTEVAIRGDHVAIGMMPDSRKLQDVQRDPRVELHSAPLEENLAAGDAKLAGLLVELARDSEKSTQEFYFRLAITIATLVQVDGEELLFTTWRPERGIRTARRR